MKKRVVITGMGVVSCFGNDLDVYYQSLLAGKSGVKQIASFDVSNFPTQIAATIENFDPGAYMDPKQARRADPCIHYGMVAGKKALEHAGFSLETLSGLDKGRTGVIIGSGMGGMSSYQQGVTDYLEKGLRRLSPFFVPFILTNMGGAMLAMDLGLMGPNYSISTACATANYSIAMAADHIRKGEVDLMIAGGSEAAIIPVGLGGFCACKAVSRRNDAPEKASRPFDKERDGFVMGEGAGVLILESLESALARGATIYAEYLGGALTCDAHHITEPHPEGEGVALAIRNALKDANIRAEDVNYINAHATSTPLGDIAEINALKKVFSQPEKITLNATKSMIGHCLGAAGGMEAIATVMAIHTGTVHPTINLDNPEPDLGFHIPTKAYDLKVRCGISNSFGFGGHNATLVFGSYNT
jgi:3-oxoacyl-[acyl-carrier-protein] synthase II